MNRLLFLGKAHDSHTERALNYCRQNLNVESHLGVWGDKFPEDIYRWQGDYIVSYLSRWVVPERVLKNARVAAVNFHTGPPEYPGIGCNNFALYHNAEVYGVTCHHMLPCVDSGPIIAVRRFPIFQEDTVATLLERSYDYQLVLFYDVVGLMKRGMQLPISDERWARKAYTRKEFDALFIITPEMPNDEIARRTRAVTFQGYGPIVEMGGRRYSLNQTMGSVSQ